MTGPLTDTRPQLPLVVAALGAFVYSRMAALQTFLHNAPDKLPAVNNIGKYEIKFADRTRNCEDAILLETHGVAIVGCDPGRDKWNTVMVSRTAAMLLLSNHVCS